MFCFSIQLDVNFKSSMFYTLDQTVLLGNQVNKCRSRQYFLSTLPIWINIIFKRCIWFYIIEEGMQVENETSLIGCAVDEN